MELQPLEQTLTELADTAKYLWEKGWAERNAGNISVNVTQQIAANEAELFNNKRVYPLSLGYPFLGGQILLVTSAGSRMRDLAKDPLKNACIVQLDSKGNNFRLWTKNNRLPTSELPTHLTVHEMLIRTDPDKKALVHSHVTELIALTQIREFCSTGSINQLLWGMHPETIMFVPKGLGFIPFEIPGTDSIASLTASILENHPVALWEKHGVLATGKNIAEAFDTIDLLAKSARIFFMVKAAGFDPEGLTTDQLDKLGQA